MNAGGWIRFILKLHGEYKFMVTAWNSIKTPSTPTGNDWQWLSGVKRAFIGEFCHNLRSVNICYDMYTKQNGTYGNRFSSYFSLWYKNSINLCETCYKLLRVKFSQWQNCDWPIPPSPKKPPPPKKTPERYPLENSLLGSWVGSISPGGKSYCRGPLSGVNSLSTSSSICGPLTRNFENNHTYLTMSPQSGCCTPSRWSSSPFMSTAQLKVEPFTCSSSHNCH